MTQAAELRDAAASHAMLEQAFRWALRQVPPLAPGDVVVQDEYTHDVLFTAADRSVLVFDTT